MIELNMERCKEEKRVGVTGRRKEKMKSKR